MERASALVRVEVVVSAVEGSPAGPPSALALLDFGRSVCITHDHYSPSPRHETEESPLSSGGAGDRGGTRRKRGIRHRRREYRPAAGTHARPHHERDRRG